MKHALRAAFILLIGMIAPATNAQEGPIREVISAQIEAFQTDDFTRAFTYASPNIRRIFGTSRNFGAMVRNGYPMVWRPKDLRFLGLARRDGALWQDVMIRDGEGRVHILEYEMIEDENGWKINAVRLREPAPGMA
ncbi:DUF4864 domain-containing protein [Roseovarius spongiae]|uniref:DUF4864 domain-containing protein n=1 Tax=Roseovarius spongiae TaxID=2320272 RepID=A0A3A8B9N1_9RHOB|nr:DUF4864 domain-containing protein [Roseovarius spongiae]RKF14933.1 DUF4864 domain-containing protein [Roseovarius spongiae]